MQRATTKASVFEHLNMLGTWASIPSTDTSDFSKKHICDRYPHLQASGGIAHSHAKDRNDWHFVYNRRTWGSPTYTI